jgi:hypothetical protein
MKTLKIIFIAVSVITAAFSQSALSNLTLTGTNTAPTATAGDNTTQISTDAFVTTAVANAVSGVNPAVAVLAASTANVVGTYSNGVAGVGATFTVTATGAFTLDGIAINTIGQRVLLKNQATGFQNGVYTAENIFFHHDGTTDITYQTTYTGTGQYDIYVRLERIQ